ncbi:MAG: hypothetical protein AAGI08_00075 [Bacteroidota bacterium]
MSLKTEHINERAIRLGDGALYVPSEDAEFVSIDIHSDVAVHTEEPEFTAATGLWWSSDEIEVGYVDPEVAAAELYRIVRYQSGRLHRLERVEVPA